MQNHMQNHSSNALHRKGFMFVLSSPSGAGKSTLSRMVLERDTDTVMSVSATTRPMRPGEVDGKDYIFVSKEEFGRMVAADEFLESAQVFGHFYGTPRKRVEESLGAGKDVLFDIDWQGTRQLAERARADVVSIFILPPSMAALEDRLKKRAQDDDATVANRMSKASHEISHWNEYDYVVINEDIDRSLSQIMYILAAERLKRSRQQGLQGFVQQLLFS